VSELVLRAESAADREAVRAVVAASFGADEVPALLDDLRTSSVWLDLSFVAELEGEVVAHVALTRAWVDAPAGAAEVLFLGPLSVRPDRAHAGIGTALVSQAIEALAGRDEPLVFVVGDPGYYSRFGFVQGDLLGFRPPSARVPAPTFQARPLPGRPGFVTGALVLPDVWWRHDLVAGPADA